MAGIGDMKLCCEGSSSLCRKYRQESITNLLRAWFAAFLIWRQCMFPLLLPPVPLCWHHGMFTGPQSDPSQRNELSSTPPLKKTVILLKAFFGLNVVPHLNPQTAAPAQVGFLSRERNEWNGRAWRMAELFLVPGEHALLEPKGSHTQSKWLKSNCFGICGLQVCP